MALVVRYYSARATTLRHVSGRAYPISAGGTVDIAVAEASSIDSSQAVALGLVGATSDRPVYVVGSVGGGLPREMYDTTLGKPIFLAGSNPVAWVDVNGSSV